MTAVGGPIESVEYRGRYFSVASDSDGNRDLGGMTNEYQPNGDGTARKIQTAKPWMIEGLALTCDDLLGDQEFLQEGADEKDDGTCTFTFANGSVWSGIGDIVGDIKFSNQNTTVPLNFSGPGKLTQQT